MKTRHFYRNRQVFKKHITTNKHKKWLSHLNNNRVNYYSKSPKNHWILTGNSPVAE